MTPIRLMGGLYWVGYYDQKPSETVCKQLLEKPNTNAHCIEGYDADSFMLALNNELGLPQPGIIDKPFTSLKLLLNNIEDIDDKERFKGVKQRLEIANQQVAEVIRQFEQGKVDARENVEKTVNIDRLKKDIINLLISADYNEQQIAELKHSAQHLDAADINRLLAGLMNNWGIDLAKLATTKSGEDAERLFNQAFDKFQQATAIKPDDHEAFYNWGNALGNLAITKSGEDAERLFNQAFDKFQQATAIKPDDHEAFNNWGYTLGDLTKTKSGELAERLFNQAFDKCQQATAIKKDYHEAFNNWGYTLGDLAKTKSGELAERLFNQAFDKYQQAIASGGSCYNLACLYATLRSDKDNALIYLNKSLENQEIDPGFVVNDEDWKAYLQDHDFLELIKRYS